MQLCFNFGYGKGGASSDVSNARCAYCGRRKNSLQFGRYGSKVCYDLATSPDLPINYGVHHD
jgi:hypothetical protein